MNAEDISKKQKERMNLNRVLREWRYAARITVRQAAREIGLSPATLNRFERGENCDSGTMASIFRWLLADSKQAAPNESI